MKISYLNNNWIIEIDITHRCNLMCRHCNRLCNAEKIYNVSRSHMDMEKVHIDYLCEQIKRYPIGKVYMLRILGGEPLLSPILDYCIHAFEELKTVGYIKEICVVSNGTIDCPSYVSKYITYYPKLIKELVLEKGKLQKEDVYRVKKEKHINITITPSDYNETIKFICDKYIGCGIHYSIYGFSLTAPCFPSMFVFPANHKRFKHELPKSIDEFLEDGFTKDVCSVCYYALQHTKTSKLSINNENYLGRTWKEQIALNKNNFKEPNTSWINQTKHE